MLTQGHIFAAFGHQSLAHLGTAVSCVVVNSRTAVPGSLFVAFPGEQVDGHNYVADAFARGAAVALVQRPIEGFPTIHAIPQSPIPNPQSPYCILVENCERALQQIARYWRTQFDLRVVGVTGSIGKTSTKEVVAAVWQQKFATLKSMGNRNNEIGLPLTLLNDLRPEHTHAVLEMGMYAIGEIATLCEIARPHIGIVTKIGPVHLSRLGSMENIVAAKRELVEALPADGVAILNADDPLVLGMANHTSARVLTYGLSPTADIWADNIESQGLSGVRCTIHHEGQAWHVHLPLLGRHSVHTALASASAGVAEGMHWEEIVRGLQTAQNQLRLVTAVGPRNSIILDDTYNASPDSVIAALNLLAEMDGRKIAVLGDMLELGTAEIPAHKLVGQRAMSVADELVAVGPLGRLIGEAALAGGMAPQQVHLVEGTDAAVALLRDLIQPRDFVLVKGSLGARLDRIVNQLTMNLEQ